MRPQTVRITSPVDNRCRAKSHQCVRVTGGGARATRWSNARQELMANPPRQRERRLKRARRCRPGHWARALPARAIAGAVGDQTRRQRMQRRLRDRAHLAERAKSGALIGGLTARRASTNMTANASATGAHATAQDALIGETTGEVVSA